MARKGSTKGFREGFAKVLPRVVHGHPFLYAYASMVMVMMVVPKSRLTTNLFDSHFSEAAGGCGRLTEAVRGCGRLWEAAEGGEREE